MLIASHAVRDGWMTAGTTVALVQLAAVIAHLVITVRKTGPLRPIIIHLVANMFALALIPAVGYSVTAIPDTCHAARSSEGYPCEPWAVAPLLGALFGVLALFFLALPYGALIWVKTAAHRRRMADESLEVHGTEQSNTVGG